MFALGVRSGAAPSPEKVPIGLGPRRTLSGERLRAEASAVTNDADPARSGTDNGETISR